MRTKKTTGIAIDPALWHVVKAHGEKTERSVSWIIDAALRQYLKTPKGKKPRAKLETTADVSA